MKLKVPVCPPSPSAYEADFFGPEQRLSQPHAATSKNLPERTSRPELAAPPAKRDRPRAGGSSSDARPETEIAIGYGVSGRPKPTKQKGVSASVRGSEVARSSVVMDNKITTKRHDQPHAPASQSQAATRTGRCVKTTSCPFATPSRGRADADSKQQLQQQTPKKKGQVAKRKTAKQIAGSPPKFRCGDEDEIAAAEKLGDSTTPGPVDNLNRRLEALIDADSPCPLPEAQNCWGPDLSSACHAGSGDRARAAQVLSRDYNTHNDIRSCVNLEFPLYL